MKTKIKEAAHNAAEELRKHFGDEGMPKRTLIQLRVNDEERDAIFVMAEKAGLSVSELIREKLLGQKVVSRKKIKKVRS